MAKATRQLAELIKTADVVLEVRDARVPFSSANPLLDSLSRMGDGRPRPRVVVFNKADLANEQLQSRVAAVEAAKGFEPLFASADRGTNVGKLLRVVDSVKERADSARTGGGSGGGSSAAVPSSSSSFRTAGALMVIVGIPNAGKSTLINALRTAGGFTQGKGVATAPTPGFTRNVSTVRVRRSPALYLCDSPGVMMPRIADVETGLKLAVTTALRDMAVPPLVMAEYLLYYFATIGSERFVGASGLSRAYDETGVEAAMGELASRHGMKRPGGGLDLDAAARTFVRDFQEGKMGRYTLDYVP
jgi:ribosome biogenesis GTPase A